MRMIFPEKTYLSRTRLIMEAFWAPTLKHLDDLQAGKIPLPADITPEYVQGFWALQKSVERSGRTLRGADKMRETLNAALEQYPDKLTPITQVFTRIANHLGQCDFGTTVFAGFSDAGHGHLQITFREVTKDIDFKERKVSAKYSKLFSHDNEAHVAIEGNDRSFDVKGISFEGRKTKAPYTLDLTLEAGVNYTVTTLWPRAGISYIKKLCAVRSGDDIRIIPA